MLGILGVNVPGIPILTTVSKCLQLIAGTAQDFPLMSFIKDTAQITGFGVNDNPQRFIF